LAAITPGQHRRAERFAEAELRARAAAADRRENAEEMPVSIAAIQRKLAARQSMFLREGHGDEMRGVVILMPSLPRQRDDLADVALAHGVVEDVKRRLQVLDQRAVGDVVLRSEEEDVAFIDADVREDAARFLVAHR